MWAMWQEYLENLMQDSSHYSIHQNFNCYFIIVIQSKQTVDEL